VLSSLALNAASSAVVVSNARTVADGVGLVGG